MKLLNNKNAVAVVCFILFVCAGVISKSYFDEYTSGFIDHTIYSSVLEENRKIFVRLPEYYDSNKSYPLIIKLDGNFNLLRWDESIYNLAKQGTIKDSIVVAIPNLFWLDSRNRDLVPPYARRNVQFEARTSNVNSPEIFGKADRFLEFIESEVLPFIERKYSINNNRVLSGFSAGGSFVLYTITTKPELFSGYFAFSPAAWYDDSVVVKEFSSGLKNTSGKPLFLYLSLGRAENGIITASFKGLLSAINLDAPENFKSDYSYSEGAGHEDNPYISVPKALNAYYEFRAGKYN
ncbi:alpha/beta hydrolase [Shewanella abyssi]|uniref:alpha/beta hydrolase n=1 Tax=Shewanella abyssi TaxID=311789 RepID=UPI00200EEE40|nr:alpha/beta hydrolase [Shewanella abyssi]